MIIVLPLLSILLSSYEDILETPLQPLYDNLDSYTYEVFERDPVKYKLYQNAITSALEDRVTDEEMDSKVVSTIHLNIFILYILHGNDLFLF